MPTLINQRTIPFISKTNKSEVQKINKLHVLTEAIDIKEFYQKDDQQNIINKISNEIQKKINTGTFNERDLSNTVLELKENGISSEHAKKLLTNLIVLSKHENVYLGNKETKWNWFSTNKTKSINTFINHHLKDTIDFSNKTNCHNINLKTSMDKINLSSILFTIGHVYKEETCLKEAKEILKGIQKDYFYLSAIGYCTLFVKGQNESTFFLELMNEKAHNYDELYNEACKLI